MMAKTTAAGWSWIGVALDLRHEEVVLDLLDQEVQKECGEDGGRPDGRRQEHGRHGGDDRPDDRDQLEDAGDDRQQDGVAAEDRIDELAQDEQADEGANPDDEAEDELAANPLAEIALDRLDDRPRVEPPRAGERPVEGGRQGRLVLEQIGDPDRQDEIGEQRAEQAPGTRDERQQERQVRATAATATSTAGDPGDEVVDPVADGERDLEMRVEVAKSLELGVELLGQLREVLMKRRISLRSGVRVTVRNAKNAMIPTT